MQLLYSNRLEILFDAEGNPFIEYTDEPELFN